jgi:dephospho-CoA kinase
VTAPPFVGLTGGIGAGKSEALAALARLGAATISTDQIVHALYEEPEVRDAVVQRWGPEVAPEGRVDRSAVARRAFATDADRHWLEQLIWPRVAQKVGEFRAKAQGVAVIVETPLLFEAGLEGNYDATIAIVAPETLRNERAAARGHASLDERTARQLSQDEKASRATYAVVNSGTLEQLEQELSGVLAKLTS